MAGASGNRRDSGRRGLLAPVIGTALVALPLAVALTAPARGADQPKVAVPATPAAEGLKLFETQVATILKEECAACHGGEKPQGGLSVTTRAALLKGGASGPSFNFTKPEASVLIQAINYHGRRMPPKGKMAPAKIAAVTRWVQLGAPWPDGKLASLEPEAHHGPPPVNAENMKFWAYQPVRRPAVPAVKDRAWVKNPVDAYVLAKLESKKLRPNPSADRTTLIRRAYYDLIGLPPTPEQVKAFVEDRSPNAWEKVVDQLLASPQYGEKWGRHWLDLVRYAETNSYERDGTKRNAWRYRDYVINSFNTDKPYDQFVKEQLAGDEMSPRTPERLIATGYYRLGIWDDEPADPKQALYDDLDDIVNTTGQVFMGMTVGCARCHDHKIDPIPAKDYYQMLAFFSGVNRYGIRGEDTVERWSLRPLVLEGADSNDPTQQRLKTELDDHRSRMATLQSKLAAVESKVAPDLKGVENDEWKAENRREALVKKRVPAIISNNEFQEYVRTVRERDRLRFFAPMALCVTETPRPRDTFILARGNPHSETDKVEPGFPSVLAPPKPVIKPTEGSSGRRSAFAEWVASPQNPLTARVMVNRVWHYHFGKGIVKTPSDFGFQGAKPTHPELLDYLAARFSAPAGGEGLGWSMKKLHRLIMLSSTYQQSSRANPMALKADPENELLWRFDMRRLLAEEVRDSILAANGSLNPKMGGPSMYPDIPREVLAGQSMPGAGWGRSSAEEQRRRSVYIFVKRSLATPLLANFDGPETDFTCAARFATTQPTQALGMLNSDWIQDQAKLFAQFLTKNAGADAAGQVKLALQRVTQREPNAGEIQRGVKLMERMKQEEKMTDEQALTAFCLVALNLNEFLHLD